MWTPKILSVFESLITLTRPSVSAGLGLYDTHHGQLHLKVVAAIWLLDLGPGSLQLL